MDESLEGLSCLAWSLRDNGADHIYRIMVVDQYMLVGQGQTGMPASWTVRKLKSPQHARHTAILRTASKERHGYVMLDGPRSKSVVAGKRAWLEKMTKHRGKSNGLDESYATVMVKGVRLEDAA